jgi:hypothetical protein
MTRVLLAACLVPLLAASTSAHADVLLIERVAARAEIELPRRGSLMSQVETQFGAPQQRHAPVGGGLPQHPPITRWDYPAFSVYFEHDHVVNAVVRRALPNEKGPKPATGTP